ncbi:MAG: response regulator [Elusimicrobia bacterium]|nr:response regulator [Elusimicrobiota bacterium]
MEKFKGKKILVVDDEEDYLNLAKTILEPEGYSVITASDGLIGMEKLSLEKPDLLILDINMPEINGFNVCEKIRASGEFKRIPIIMLTVRRKEEDKIKGLETGADDYITKPFHPRELISRVRTVLRRSG